MVRTWREFGINLQVEELVVSLAMIARKPKTTIIGKKNKKKPQTEKEPAVRAYESHRPGKCAL